MTFDELVKRTEEDNDFVCCVVKEIYRLQEADEKHARKTIHKNGVGFSCADAAMFSDCARYANQHGYLTPKQLEVCRKPTKRGYPKLAVYHRQILELPICGERKRSAELAADVESGEKEAEAT